MYNMEASLLRLILLTTVIAVATAHCPPYWTAYLDSCYRIYPQRISWDEAERKCMESSTCEGNEIGHLASIGSAQVNTFLVNVKKLIEVQGGAVERVWIGLNDLFVQNSFEWTNGQNVTFTNWEIGQPNNARGQEHCVSVPGLNTLDQWDDTNCIETLPFICELPGIDRSQQIVPVMYMMDPGY